MNLQDLLDGPLVLEFLNGNILAVTIHRVIWNMNGEPIALIGDDLAVYNWRALVQARRH